MRPLAIAAALFLIQAAFGKPLAAQAARPTFLYLVEGTSVPTGKPIHVFNVNLSSGALSEVPGSPFNAGFSPSQLVVDPTGRFVYVINEQSNDITEYSVDSSSGTLTELPGSPVFIGAVPVTMAADPTGRFLYVFATTVVNGVEQEQLYIYAIDAVTGVLTLNSSSPSFWQSTQGSLATSISFDPTGTFAYVAQSNQGSSGAPITVCSVSFGDGTLTQIGSTQPAVGEGDNLTISPNGSFLFSIDHFAGEADSFTIDAPSGQLSETPGSPVTVENSPNAVLVDPSGKFLYVVNGNETYQPGLIPSQYSGSISAFAIDQVSGVLTPVPGTPFGAGINPVSVVVEPRGHFAYTAATEHPSGIAGLAEILGYSIDPTSGALNPTLVTPWVDTAESTAAGLVISPGPATVINPTPLISSLSPSSTTATDTPFTLQVNGANFVPGSIVYFGGQARSTTFINSRQLEASIFGTDIDNGGTAIVFVFSPLPGGGASTSVEFPVSNLLPSISSLNPAAVAAQSPGAQIGVAGTGFVTSSVVNFNGTAIPTVFNGPTLITANIPASDLTNLGTASISVTNPSNGVSGGGTSNSVVLTIGPAVPPQQPLSVSSTSPASAMAGGPAFTLTVNGTGFVQGSSVSFNLNAVQTIFVSATQLTAAIPASAIAIAGNPYVLVTNPDGSASAPLNFPVLNPQPGGGSVSAGSNALTLNITGTGFVQGSIVYVNGASRATTFLNSTLLQATLLPSDLAQGGTLIITVVNPPPGGGTTGAISFRVADFSVTPPNSVPSVTAGQTANFALMLSPSNGAFSYPVSFSASGLPTGATGSFTPSTPVTPGATPQTVMLSIATTARTGGVLSFRRPSMEQALPQAIIWTLVFLALASALLFFCRGGESQVESIMKRCGRQFPRASVTGAACLLALALIGLITIQEGCGVAGSSSTSSTNSSMPLNIAGNWSISTTSSKFATRTNITGTITQSGSMISGSLNISGTPCAQAGSLSGSLNGSTFTASLNENGQAVALTGTVALDTNSASGSYSAPSGGCTNGDTGTWIGNKTPAAVNPSGTPAGTYPITVTATSEGVSHSTTVTLTVM